MVGFPHLCEFAGISIYVYHLPAEMGTFQQLQWVQKGISPFRETALEFWFLNCHWCFRSSCWSWNLNPPMPRSCIDPQFLATIYWSPTITNLVYHLQLGPSSHEKFDSNSDSQSNSIPFTSRQALAQLRSSVEATLRGMIGFKQPTWWFYMISSSDMLISDASIREIGFQRRSVAILSTNKGITLANMWYDGDVMEDTVGIYLDTLKGLHVATSLEVWLGLGYVSQNGRTFQLGNDI